MHITAKTDSDTALIWSNRAGRAWTLDFRPAGSGYDRTMFLVQSDSPYFIEGHKDGQISWAEETEWNGGNIVLGVTRPYDELYTRV